MPFVDYSQGDPVGSDDAYDESSLPSTGQLREHHSPYAMDQLRGVSSTYASHLLEDPGSELARSVSSVGITYDDEAIKRMRQPIRDEIMRLEEKLSGHINNELYYKGQILSLEEYVALQISLEKDPSKWSKSDRAQIKAVVSGADETVAGNLRYQELTTQIFAKKDLKGDIESTGSLASDLEYTGLLRSDARLVPGGSVRERKQSYPSPPKFEGTVVDSLSPIDLFAHRESFSMADVDSLKSHVTKYSPYFAQFTSGAAPSGLISPRVADEASRILREEWGFQATKNGYDFTRPRDIFSMGRAPALDSADQANINFFTSAAVDAASRRLMSPFGSFDFNSPFGVSLKNGSYRSDRGFVGKIVGSANARIGSALSSGMLNFKDPLIGMAFPEANDWTGSHPVQTYLANSADFIFNFLFEGANTKDIRGSHWLPFQGIKSSLYRSINTLREETGAAAMGVILDPYGDIRPVSMLKDATMLGYSRDIFVPSEWQKIRGLHAAAHIGPAGTDKFPLLSPASSGMHLDFLVGSYVNDYSKDQSPVPIDNQYKYLSTTDKNGIIRLNASHVSGWQLDHLVPLSYAYEHGVAKLYDEMIEAYGLSDTASHEGAAAGLQLMKSDAVLVGNSPNSKPGYTFDDTKARAIQRLIFGIGMAKNPLQFHMTTDKMNREKGAKGPGGWLPYPLAKDADEHEANKRYVFDWRSVIASTKDDYSTVCSRWGMQYDPEFLKLDRKDELALRGVDLGVDAMGRFTAPFGRAFVEYLDMPNLSDPTLHGKINQTMAISEASFAWKLALWSFVGKNQAYLIGREHLVDGVFGQLWPAEGKSRGIKGVVDWHRRRWAGIPFLGGTMSSPGIGDDAIYTLDAILRSGKNDEIYDAKGEVIRYLKSKVHVATFDQAYKYASGAPNAFGEAETMVPKMYQMRPILIDRVMPDGTVIPRLIKGSDELNARYFHTLETGDLSYLSLADQESIAYLRSLQAAHPETPAHLFPAPARANIPLSAEAHSFWLEERDFSSRLGEQPFENAISSKVGSRSKHINNHLLASLRLGFCEQYEISRTSQVGRALVNPNPFLVEAFDLLRQRKFKEAFRKGTIDLSVKLIDWSILGNGLGATKQMPAILMVETGANILTPATGVTSFVRGDYGNIDFRGYEGGLFGWATEERKYKAAAVRALEIKLRDDHAAVTKIIRAAPSSAASDRAAATLASVPRSLWFTDYIERHHTQQTSKRFLEDQYGLHDEFSAIYGKMGVEPDFLSEGVPVIRSKVRPVHIKDFNLVSDVYRTAPFASDYELTPGLIKQYFTPEQVENHQKAIFQFGDRSSAYWSNRTRAEDQYRATAKLLRESRFKAKTFEEAIRSDQLFSRLLSAPGLLGKFNRWSYQLPRLTMGVGLLRNLPNEVKAAMMSPLRLHDWVSNAPELYGNRLLAWSREEALAVKRGTQFIGPLVREQGVALSRASSWVGSTARFGASSLGQSLRWAPRVGGFAFGALGFAEAAVRYKRANGLAARPWESLTLEEKAEYENYADPTIQERALGVFRDVGIAYSLPTAVAGVSLARLNDAAASSMARSDQYAPFRMARALGDSIPYSELSRVDLQTKADRERKILARSSQLIDSAGWASEIRRVGRNRGDSDSLVDVQLGKMHSKWTLVPRVDSAMFPSGHKGFGGEWIEAKWRQSPQFTADRSIVVRGPGQFDTLPLVAPAQRLSHGERNSRLASMADDRNRAALLDTAYSSGSFFRSILSYVIATRSEGLLSGGPAADSVLLAKDLAQRERLRRPAGGPR